jgi:hypothetical protein
MNTVCIKSDDVIFLDENNFIIESTVPGYSADLIQRFEGNDIIRYYEFVPCEYKILNTKMLMDYEKKIKQDMNIPNHIVRFNYDLHHIKIKIRKILKKSVASSNDMININIIGEPVSGSVNIGDPVSGSVNIGEPVSGSVNIGDPITIGYSSKLNIFERTYFSYVVDFNSFKLFDINNNFIRIINVDKCEYYNEYRYPYPKFESKPGEKMYMDANKNYLSYYPNDLDSCIVEFDIFI